MPAHRLVPPDDWPTLGWELIDWIEAYLAHGPGDVEGQPMVLDDEFAQFLLDCYRLYPRSHELAGRRVVSEAELSRAKGRAKSELAGAVVVAEFRGPVRFDGWNAAGEPVGKPVTYPFIRCLATEESQASNTYDGVLSMLSHAAEHHPDEFGGIDAGLTRTLLHRGRGGEIRPCTAAAASKDGGKETHAVGDELHLYTTPELRSMYRVVSRNLRKRKEAQGWMLGTTTQFRPGEDSIAEEHHRDAEQQTSGASKRRISFLRDHREGHELDDEEWEDDDLQLASLREAYGAAAEWMDLRSILEDDIRSEATTRAEAERYWHNRRPTGDGNAVSADDWDAMADPEREVPAGACAVLCFDGSKLDYVRSKYPDCTALEAWVLEPDRLPHLVELGVWDPRAHSRDGLRDQVRHAVAEAFARFRVLRMVADPPHWRDEIDGWAEEHGEDIVLQFDTMSPKRMGAAIERMVREAIPGRSFTHDGAAATRRHALNAVLTQSKRGNFDALVKPKDTEKIDAFIAATIGWAELPHVELPETVDLLTHGIH